MELYSYAAKDSARKWADRFSIARPIATRAIAPTGTISIAGGLTTPGIEPVFHTAYLRTVNTLKTQEHGNGYYTTPVIDPVVRKWISKGYDVRDIDTAYTLSQSVDGIERRIAFQAFMQQYVDNAISSTVNLPEYTPGIEEKISPILLRYLPFLRGITFYPNGRYDNQPVVPIDIKDALKDGVMDQYEACKGGVCGL
jgi:ribonucleoside-diphosphate reductase alpha chain